MPLRLNWLVVLAAIVAVPEAPAVVRPAGATAAPESIVPAAEARVLPAAPGDRPQPLEERLDEVWDGEDDDDDDDHDSPAAPPDGTRAHPPRLSFDRLRLARPLAPRPIARHCVPRSPPCAR